MKKKMMVAVLFMFLTILVFSESGYITSKDNFDSSKEYLTIISFANNDDDGKLVFVIGIGSGNKGTLNVGVLTDYTFFGVKRTPLVIYYKFDDFETVQSYGLVSNNEMMVAFRDGENVWNGTFKYNKLVIRVVDYNGTNHDYVFDLNDLRVTYKDIGLIK